MVVLLFIVLVFNFFFFLKNLSTVLHSSCTSLHSHQTLRQLHSWQCKCSLSSTSSSSTFIPCVLLITILCTGWYLIVDLICISLMISDVDHLFMDLLEPDFFFFWKMSIQILCPIFNQIAGFYFILFLLLNCMSYVFLHLNPL